ncbi:LacI family DNA-binding transcriptional regulator [bacterium RCC_150]
MTSLSIRSGQSASGGPRRATMRDVAALAGVGIKTVSRVVNGERDVSEATAARVRRAAEELDFVPDLRAGSLRRNGRRTDTIGLLVSSVENPFPAAVHRAVEDEFRPRGLAVLASSVDDDPEIERARVATLLGRRVDGIILAPAPGSQEYLHAEQERGLPLVCVDRKPFGIEADTVMSDNKAGAAVAAAHLITHGHRRIAVFGHRKSLQTAQQRKAGFLEEAGSAGIAAAQLSIVEDLRGPEQAEAAAASIFASLVPPTAVFCSQNLVTVGVLRALRKLNAHRTTALVSFDDLDFGELLEPGLTAVAQDPHAIGALAAQRLLARLDGEEAEPLTTIVPTRLIARGSGEIPPPST